MLSRLNFHLEDPEEDLIIVEVEDVLHQEEEDKIHSLRVEGQHQAHKPISHQHEEGGATILTTIIKEKCMTNLTSNVIIVINLGILHLSVEKDNMT